MSKRKVDSAAKTPAKKKVKISSSAKKKDGKPILAGEWTRTDPITGKRGKLFRKDLDYYKKQNLRRKKYIDQRSKSKTKSTKKAMDEDDDLKEEKKNVTKMPEALYEAEVEYHELTNRFENHVCVVTGGGRGMGQSIAIRFAQEGAIVYVLDKIRWLDTVKLLNEAYGTEKNLCKGIRCDVTDPKQVKDAVGQIIAENGYIDVLVNAVTELDDGTKKAHEFNFEDIQKSMNLNFFSMFNMCKAVIPYMLKEEYGRIVSIASLEGREGRSGHFSYSLSTGATITATKTMGKEYAGTGITINCVAPVVDYQVEKLGKKEEKKIAQVPMGRPADQAELSGLVAFIASEENCYTTGFCYDLTGGLM